jgi:uncharacterized protein YjbI with pentapeptide repeats
MEQDRYQRRKQQRAENRQKLTKRWQDAKGQQVRQQLLAGLRAQKAIPTEFVAPVVPELIVHRSSDYVPPPGADLRCLDLSGENLDGVDLSGARLQGANLTRASLQGAKLVEADLRDTVLVQTDFTNADLRQASLGGAVLDHTILPNANLEGVYLDRKTTIAHTALPPSVERAKSSLFGPLSTSTHPGKESS